MQSTNETDHFIIDTFMLKLEKLRYDLSFEYRETQYHPISYAEKRDFLTAIRNGDMAKVLDIIHTQSLQFPLNLCEDEAENYKMHMRILLYSMTDAVIEGGVPETVSTLIRDSYLRASNSYDTPEQLKFLLQLAAKEFTNQSYIYQKYKTVSPQILRCINYIQLHLHEKITLADLVGITFLSERHLTRKFKAEVGFSIQTYIQSERIQAGKLMLIFSSLTIVEISQYLCFCSESHFCSVFKKHSGLTPRKYRSIYKQKEVPN